MVVWEMTTAAEQPTPEFDVKPSDNFGPDPSNVADDPKPARSFPKLNTKLGTNKKLRGGPRKLVERDREKIEQLYTALAMGVMPFKPKTAQMIAQSAEDCANAWFQLADENDSVRRTLLMFIEGGAWGALFAAHMPILMSLIPDGKLPFPISFGLPTFQDTDTVTPPDGGERD
jgi:hypothetical protein